MLACKEWFRRRREASVRAEHSQSTMQFLHAFMTRFGVGRYSSRRVNINDDILMLVYLLHFSNWVIFSKSGENQSFQAFMRTVGPI